MRSPPHRRGAKATESPPVKYLDIKYRNILTSAVRPVNLISNPKHHMHHSSSKALKRLTEQVKALRDLDRLPNALTFDKNEEAAKAYVKATSGQPTKASVRYWFEAPVFEDTRRAARAPVEAALDSLPKDSVRY